MSTEGVNSLLSLKSPQQGRVASTPKFSLGLLFFVQLLVMEYLDNVLAKSWHSCLYVLPPGVF